MLRAVISEKCVPLPTARVDGFIAAVASQAFSGISTAPRELEIFFGVLQLVSARVAHVTAQATKKILFRIMIFIKLLLLYIPALKLEALQGLPLFLLVMQNK
jgi:hypothetical protein